MNRATYRLAFLYLVSMLVFSCAVDAPDTDTTPGAEDFEVSRSGNIQTPDAFFDFSRISDGAVGPALFPARGPDTVVYRYGDPRIPEETIDQDVYLDSLKAIGLLRDGENDAAVLAYRLRDGEEVRLAWTNVVALDATVPAYAAKRLRIGAFELERIDPASPDARFVFFRINGDVDRTDVLSMLQAAAQAYPDRMALPVFLSARALRRVLLTGEFVVQTPGPEYSEIVRAWAAGLNGKVTREMRRPGRFLVRVPSPGSVEFMDALADIRAQDWTLWAEPDLIQDCELDYVPNDPHYQYQWHLNNTGQISPGAVAGGTPDADVDAPEAWDGETGDAGVTIAIIDTGVQCDHPDFAGRCDAGYDFWGDDADPSPSDAGDNHGQACAGVAAAHGNNAEGVAGVCYDCRILPVKISQGSSWVSDAGMADAIEFAADNADILSNSWSSSVASTPIHDAIIYAVTQGRGGRGAPTFFASGNSRIAYQRNFSDGIVTGLPAATWTIRFDFRKNDSLSFYHDAAFIDSVLLMNGDGSVAHYEGFETDSVPGGWTECSGSDAAWIGSGDPYVYYGGMDVGSIRSGSIDDLETSCVQFTATTTVGGGQLFFRYLQSSHNLDRLYVEIDDGTNSDEYAMYTYQSGTPQEEIKYPARFAETIAVGASTDMDIRSPYSQYGPELDFVAPSSGGWARITTTDRTGADGYNNGSDPNDIADADYTSEFGGTSSATPLAAGIAGLLLSDQPSLTADTVRQVLRDTAEAIGPLPYSGGRNDQYGWGRVNAYNVLHSGLECYSDVDCDNGLYCDGAETCVDNACTPSPGSPCTGACLTGFCNEGGDYCYVATGCWINETCYDDWSHNPDNPCQVCDPAVPYIWTNDDAAACDDGEDCTYADHCSGGVCVATPYSCDDGKSCTLDHCNGDGTCDNPILPMNCLIDDVCYNRWEDNPANPCQECRDDWGVYYDTHWGYDNAASCSDDLFCTTVHYCQIGICQGTGPDPCDDVCGFCNESTDTCDNVPGPCDDGLWCNGDDSCENGTCSDHAGNPCSISGGECEYCDESLDQCVVVPGTCSIDSACYADGDPHPTNPCQYCDADASGTSWSDRIDGTSCDDGLWCNGTDTCNGGTCSGSTSPCDAQCQSCNEDTDTCSDIGGACDDGVYCNGADACAGGTCSQHAGNPCDAQCQSCNETSDACDDLSGSCDDGLWCNGTDTCSGGTCSVHAGTPCPDDGLWCNGDESCNENGDICVSSGNPCTDGSWCNGVEGCDEAIDTCDGTHSGNPCAPDCGNCTDTDWDFGLCDGLGNPCDDGLFCNGADTCDQTGCIGHAGDPCGPDQTCNEDLDICEDEGAVCGNGTIEEGEDCEQDADCTGDLVCVDCLCEEETAIELLSFEAEADIEEILLTWETAAEPDNVGFHLWRSRSETASYDRVTTALIPAEGDGFTGASYEWIDDGLDEGTYFYKLEDLDIFGNSKFHGPASATVQEEPGFACGS